jgi:hypothetical protein
MTTLITLVAGALLAAATSVGVVTAVDHSTSSTPSAATPLVPYGSR